jgi:peptidoglycan/xylan/chitin deacetylase (PgdA/CDA1 family)
MLKKLKLILYSIALFLGKRIYYNRSSKVFYYHDVHQDNSIPETDMSTPLSLFVKHVELITQQGFEIVELITEPKNQIMITFDDGFRGVYLNKACFQSKKIKPTVFIITEKIGDNHFLNAAEMKELTMAGFKFESHTHTHITLNKLSKKKLRFEFDFSKEILKKTLNINTDAICFPKGYFDASTIEMAYLCGYKKLYSSIPGGYYEENSFQVKYRNLVQFASPFDLKCILFGGLRIFRKRYTLQHYFN